RLEAWLAGWELASILRDARFDRLRACAVGTARVRDVLRSLKQQPPCALELVRPESIAAKLTNSQDEGMCVCINHRSVMRNTLPLLRPDLRRLRLARQPCGAQACGLLSDRLLLGQILGHRRRAILRHALAPQRELFAAGSRTGLARRGY